MTATETLLEQISAIVGFTVIDAKFASRHEKHPGCSYRGGNPESEDLTRWGLEVFRVQHEIESMDDVAGGGSIGCGSRELVIALTDEDGEDHDFPEGEAYFPEIEKLLPAGKPDPRTVAELAAPVWDGNNHTSPDVSTIAGICRLDSFGHWDAADWLQFATIEDGETAASIVSDAEEFGVHLDLDDVADYIRDRM